MRYFWYNNNPFHIWWIILLNIIKLFSAIKSENTDISGDALFNLFGTVIATRISVDENVLTNKDKSMENMCFKKAEFFLDLEYWLSDQIYTQAAEKQGIIF